MLVAALLLAASSAAQEPALGALGEPSLFLRADSLQEQQPSEPSQGPLPVFEFHSGFWINLHHFLYQQARIRKYPLRATTGTSPPEQAEARGRPPSAVPAATDVLTEQEQQAWAAAVDFYAHDLADRDLLFNGDMVNLNNRLAEMETCADLSGRSSPECASGLRKEIIVALERAAPVYRARWWSEHDRSNRNWIASVGPLVRHLGGRLAQQLSEIYRSGWPAGRLRVDVVFYAGRFGAYTSLDPVHLTISSSDVRNQGPAALEVLFHEASHALAGEVRDTIVRECRARGKPIPRDLWHALLFYTTGETVKHALETESSATNLPAGARPANYTPYAYRYGLFARGWNTYQRVLERYWQPYLDGKAEFDSALARLVSAL